jgi:hypothetical protein
MDLLTSSGSSVPAAAAGKAVGTWATRRPLGGSTTVDLLRRWAPLDAATKLGDAAAGSAPPCELSLRGRGGGGSGGRGGVVKVSRLIVKLGSLG